MKNSRITLKKYRRNIPKRSHKKRTHKKRSYKKRSHKKRSYKKRKTGGAEETPPTTNPVAEKINGILNEYNQQLSEEKDPATIERLEFEAAAVSIAHPLCIDRVMTDKEKRRAKVWNGASNAVGMIGSALLPGIGSALAAITDKLAGALVKITEELYKDFDGGVGKARGVADISSPKEDHRVMVSLMVNTLMPKDINPSLFLNLCRLWVTGAVIVNRDWFGQKPVAGIKDDDPKSKPSSAEKELYDRIWSLSKKFIGMKHGDWNTLLAKIDITNMDDETRKLLLNRSASINSTKQPLSKMIGPVIAQSFMEIFPGMDALTEGGRESIEQFTQSLNEIMPDLAKQGIIPDEISEHFDPEKAKDFINAMISKSPCNEVDCPINSKIKTNGGSVGTIFDGSQLKPEVKKIIDADSVEGSTIYASFDGEDIPETFKKDTHKHEDRWVYGYPKRNLRRIGTLSGKAKEFAKQKILKEMGVEDEGEGAAEGAAEGAKDPTSAVFSEPTPL